ncbi:MAG: cadmium-translocating P-type ATPase [Clostridiaceae bacterium]|nr:cadmium-translocating P-type ATPase [Clostridiaceae bacterium]
MKKQIIRLAIGGVLFLSALIPFEILKIQLFPLELALYIAAYLVVGGDVVLRALKNILHGRVFDENFLMTIASVGAFAILEFPEAVAVMLFYQVGELFQSYAVGKSRRSIAALMDIRPDYANVFRDGAAVKSDPNDVAVGDMILIGPGERVPLDGVVTEGESTLDTSALTGESAPRAVALGDTILSGCININGVLKAEVTKEFGESTASKILELVENAAAKKSRSESFITKFARYYTPAVVIVAVLFAVILPFALPGTGFKESVYRALSFLVVSCPCALVISVPMSFFGGIGRASRCGILLKGGDSIDALARVNTVVFDKTGTLTEGTFRVTEVVPADGVTEARILEAAALAESYSSHPIAVSLRRAYGKETGGDRVSGVTELAGFGITADIDGKRTAIGNKRLMEKEGADFVAADTAGTVVYIAENGIYLGAVVIADAVKQDAATAITELRASGVKRMVMLTGDSAAAANAVAKTLDIDEVYSGLLPGDKVEILEKIIAQSEIKTKEKSAKQAKKRGKRGSVVFVGDGINDAPVLARADAGVAMGAAGSEAAVEAADVVIMDDKPSKLATAVRISKKTVLIAVENTTFAIGVKLLILAITAAGLTGMWLAVFADVGVAVIAILNAFRALGGKKASSEK